jgi:tetratricopeptide (TPR) repeat protein
MDLHHLDLGLAELDRAEKMSTGDTAMRVLWESAFYHRELKHYSAALAQYNSLLQMKNLTGLKRAWAIYQRAEIYQRTNRLELALKDLNDSIKVDSSPAEVYHTRGIVLLQLGKPRQALPDYSIAIERLRNAYSMELAGGLDSRLSAILKERAIVFDSIGRSDLAKKDRSSAQKYEQQTFQGMLFRFK